jgi:hypothetical protein
MVFTLVELVSGEGAAPALSVEVFESVRFCAGRLYRSGDGLTAEVSPRVVSERSGILVVILISEPL